jgi:hypothetical protein
MNVLIEKVGTGIRIKLVVVRYVDILPVFSKNGKTGKPKIGHSTLDGTMVKFHSLLHASRNTFLKP